MDIIKSNQEMKTQQLASINKKCTECGRTHLWINKYIKTEYVLWFNCNCGHVLAVRKTPVNEL